MDNESKILTDFVRELREKGYQVEENMIVEGGYTVVGWWKVKGDDHPFNLHLFDKMEAQKELHKAEEHHLQAKVGDYHTWSAERKEHLRAYAVTMWRD